ncbi:pyridoxal phosphate-dependent decarboxylase family protein [Flavihumibacter petaseus]|uniref:Putative aromatic L-amino acid decarboxylase n=1 Tax=Flavihumibacter petaseus NBRC 106054 TaxID=1220578 RepID=A0A0E9MYV1_9BACT|nr:pyridoxal-dependent decarboxylase [Flavihumibacter petaseus]GAO42290.1 putative aromatic L-amino acid decarboxylase [Flavihumibacter petaseus NBRC 106054]
MNEQLKADLADLDNLLSAVQRQGTETIQSLEIRPTTAPESNTQTEALNETGIGAAAALQLFNERFEKLMVASAGPRYLGFVTGGATPAAVMGDWLTAIYDQNTQAINGNGDVSARIELETINLLLELFNLPKSFFGGFVTGATMSNFTCLAVARQWVGRQKNIDIARDGLSGPLPVLSATPHSSAIKSLAMLGLGSNNLVKVQTLPGAREAMDINDLAQKLEALKGEPGIVISSGGTVNTVDFDDNKAIAQLKTRFPFWWHIDAAFGAFAACSPTYQHLLEGWEAADSITVDNHKWLNVPYDSAVFLVKEEHRLLQVEGFQNSNAPYLGDPLANFSYMNFVPENSRRQRALPAWFTLKAYGKEGYRSIVESSIQMAKLLGEKIETSTQFQLLAPVRLNTVCFTLKNATTPEAVHQFLNRLTSGGKVFMTPTVYQGRSGMRAAFVNWQTTAADVELIWEEMNSTLNLA